MKIFSTLGFVCGLVLLASCSNENEDIVEQKNKVYKTFSLGYTSVSVDQTRLVVDDLAKLISDGQAPFNWDQFDAIDVFPSTQDGVGEEYKIKESSINNPDKNVANFEGYSIEDKTYFLLYPYQADAQLTSGGGSIIAQLPHEQNALEDTFDRFAALQVGKTSNMERTTKLRNVCSFLYIQLPEGVDHVTVESGADLDWKCAGKVSIDVSTGNSSITEFIEGEHTITLQGIEGKAGYYVICIAPSSQFPSIKTTVYYQNRSKISRIAKGTRQFDAGTFYSLGIAPQAPAEADVTVPDVTYDYEGSGCTCDWVHGNCKCDMNDPFSEDNCGCM